MSRLLKITIPIMVIAFLLTAVTLTQRLIETENPKLNKESNVLVKEKSVSLYRCAELVTSGEGTKAQQCFVNEFKNAWLAGEFENFNKYLTQTLKENERAYQACHDAGHKAGYELLKEIKLDESVVVRALNKENACDNGFIHGLFDAVGNQEGMDENTWWELAKGCNKLIDSNHRNQCGDGSGHGAFQLKHDIIAALTLCAKHTDTFTKDACMQGVYMQILRPDHDQNFPALIDPNDLEAKWTDLCKEISSKSQDQSFNYNCEIILSKLLTHRMIPITEKWGFENGRYNQEIASFLKKEVPNAVAQCDKFKEKTRNICRVDLARMSVFVSSMQNDLHDTYCGYLPKELLTECLSARTHLLGSNLPNT